MESPAPVVLVVEDDPAIQEVLSDMLSIGGYAVEIAWDGQEAIAAVERHSARLGGLALVLLDMMLPVVDGAGVLRRLSELGNQIPVVAMSADTALLNAARIAGAQSVLQKPFDMPALMALVRQYSAPQ